VQDPKVGHLSLWLHTQTPLAVRMKIINNIYFLQSPTVYYSHAIAWMK